MRNTWLPPIFAAGFFGGLIAAAQHHYAKFILIPVWLLAVRQLGAVIASLFNQHYHGAVETKRG